MGNKNQKTFLFSFLILLLFAGVFCFSKKTFSNNSHLIINEIATDENNDWVEIYNPTDKDVNLAQENYRLYKVVSSKPYLIMKFGNESYGTYPTGTVIKSKSSYLIVRNDADDDLRLQADAIGIDSSFTWSSKNCTLYLSSGPITSDDDTDIVDKVGFGSAKYSETQPAPEIPEGKSIARINFQDTNNNSLDFKIVGEEEVIEEEIKQNPKKDQGEDQENYLAGIRVNEILPNPKGTEALEEYIEIFNGEDFEIDLENWTLKDSSKNKKSAFVFPKNSAISPGKFLILYRSLFKFALNNSGSETITLLAPDGEEISSVSYSQTKEGFSYGFDGENWRWSKFLTPGKENKFNSPPEINVKKPKDVFESIPVNFEAKAKTKNKEEVEYLWNFGDGKKSYLSSPIHTYQKAGEYAVTLTAENGIEKISQSFALKVRKFPKLNLEITGLLPNPFGKDAGNEWIEIKNNSKRKVNLKGWKIATGWDTLVNHAILTDFIIPAGQFQELSRENAFFYLNNKRARVELRYPNGKTASKVSYEKDEIGDDEIYTRVNGQWQWVSPENIGEEEAKEAVSQDSEKEENALSPPPNNEREIKKEGSNTISPTKIQSNTAEYLESSNRQNKREKLIALLAYGTTIAVSDKSLEAQEKFLAAGKIEKAEAKYLFTKKSLPEKHWTKKLIESAGVSLNSFMNKLFVP